MEFHAEVAGCDVMAEATGKEREDDTAVRFCKKQVGEYFGRLKSLRRKMAKKKRVRRE